MNNEMIVINKADISELINQFKIFNENISKLELREKSDKQFFTRDEAQEFYKFSKREVDKIYNTLLRDKVVNIGKHQRLAKVHIDNLLTEGCKMKYV